jgi:hypothetical protein
MEHHFSYKVQNITRDGRNALIVMPRSIGSGAHRQKGDKNGHHIDNVMESRSIWGEEQLEAHRRRQFTYRNSNKGKTQMEAYLQKSAAIVVASRATEVYHQVGSECISDEVDAMLSDTWEDLGDMTPLDYLLSEEEGGGGGCGQFFLTRQDTVYKIWNESAGILCDKGRMDNGTNPPLMVDPYARGLAMPVPRNRVEEFGLKQLNFAQARDLGWDYIEICVLDLTDTSILEDPNDPEQIKRISRAAYAVEQQCQYKLMKAGLELHQLLNRIPGAGKWNDGPGVYMIGFGFFPPTIQDYIGTSLVSVEGKMKSRVRR